MTDTVKSLFGGGSSLQMRKSLAHARDAVATAGKARLEAAKDSVGARQAVTHALDLAHQANAVADKRAEKVPFPTAEKAANLEEATHLPASQQKQLFGQTLPKDLDKASVPKPVDPVKEKEDAQVRAAADEINRSADNIQGTDKPYEGSDSEKDARRQATVEATATLDSTLASVPPHLRGRVLEQSGGAIEKMTRGSVILDGGDNEKATQNLAAATEKAGRENAHLITAPIAEVIKSGGMEEHGSLGGRHDHRSEQEFVDGVRKNMDSGGGDLFARSLANELHTRGDTAFAHAIATGGDVPGKNFAERATEFAGDVGDAAKDKINDVKDFVGDVANAGGDFIRNKAADLSGIDDKIRALDSGGDKVTMGVGGELGAFGVKGGAQAEMSVEKNPDGSYKMTLSGEASCGVFAGLGLNKHAGGEVNAGVAAKMSVEMQFKTREEAEAAARTVVGIGVGTAAGGAVGAAVTSVTAGDELKNISDHVEKTTIEVQANASAEGGVGIEGLSPGAGASAKIAAGYAIEIEKGKPPTLVVKQSLEGEANLNLGSEVKIPGVTGELSLASAGAKGKIELEHRIPMPNVELNDIVSDPMGTLKKAGNEAMDKATTTIKVDADVKGALGPNVKLANGTDMASSGLAVGGGLNVKAEVTVGFKDANQAIADVFKGNIGTALTRLGDNAQMKLEVNGFKDGGMKIDESFSAGVFKVGVQAEYSTRDETDLYTFSGSPKQLAAEGAEFFKDLSLMPS